MRVGLHFRSAVSLLFAQALFMFCSCEKSESGSADVVFVGASITERWDFDQAFPGQNFAKAIHYDSDKTAVWGDAADYGPRIIAVKECAAYFNTDCGTPIASYIAVMERMVTLCRATGITPVLASTIPVQVEVGGCTQAQLNDIKAFNTRLRSYCASQGIVCLDLFAAVADPSGQLPAAYHDGDGLHPNQAGYDALSAPVIPTLKRAEL